MVDKDIKRNPDMNPDPITGEKGAHPVGTGIGAAGVGAAATAVGAVVGGPVGAVVGAAVGSVAGGLVGKGVAEQIDPTVEEAYWRNNYRSRDYVESDYDYDNDYANAYRTGYEGYSNYSSQGLSYAAAEPRLREDYEKQRGNSRLGWDKAKYAAQDAWNRIDNNVRGRRENDDYWRQNYQSRPYAADRDYDHYAPAYSIGYDSYRMYAHDRGMTYEQAEPHIRSDYERRYKDSDSTWDQVKDAVRDSWNRAKDAVSSDDRRTYNRR